MSVPIPDPEHYTYRVLWSPEDDEFVGLCVEFPSLSWLAPTQAKALKGIVDVVADVLRDMAGTGEPIPQPLSERKYSGRFVVRTSSELHARLTLEAAEQGVSMNQLANHKLASPSPTVFRPPAGC
jgi:predicted HicB family RNase H-like nuclease